MEKILKEKTSLLYVFRNKLTGEYVDEDGNPTEDIYEAVGYRLSSDAKEAIKTFDEPDEWYLVTKLTTVTIVGEPIEIKEFI